MSGSPAPWRFVPAVWCIAAATAFTLSACDGAASPTPQPESTSCPSDKFALWTGSALRGSNIFLGRNADGGPDGFGDGEFRQSDLDDLREAGANYVHISAAGLFSERPPYDLDPAAQASLDRMIQWIERAGMYASIAIRSGPGRNEDAITARDAPTLYEPIWRDQGAQDAWVRMVRYMAERYRSSPTIVGYAPMVEPNNVARHDYPRPQIFYATYGGTSEDVNQLYARATAAIRQVDPTTPILLEPEAFGAVEWLPYLKVTGDSRTVYTVHAYEPMPYTHEEKSGLRYPGVYELDGDGKPAVVDRNALERHMRPVGEFGRRNGVPVAVTEFGVHRTAPNARGYLGDRIEIHNGLGSWAVWTWQAKGFDDPFNLHDASAVHDVLVGAWRKNCSPLSHR